MKLTAEELARCAEIGLDVRANHKGPIIKVEASAASDAVTASPKLGRLAKSFGNLQQHEHRDALLIEYPDGDDGLILGPELRVPYVHD
ncbi:MAG: hypothetical protein HRT82_16730 [Henriciella sp.]|nr:hypothetical protein [Henriciella sp.]